MSALEITLRLLAAAICGAAVGLNRNFHGKATGVRTLAVVALGSAIAVMAADDVGGDGDATRAVQGILTGIGFLGAGVIIRGNVAERVHGLTTAASTWLTACLGIACALTDWRLIVPGLALTIVVLMWGGDFEKAVRRRFMPADDDMRPPPPTSRS
ncbi:MgtC/SapB family protein [Pseudolabrys taiwanensis]|uniref:Protein MgtC n=1 Tax=Pseudolabrys taiwanensis TaxID=331696 RepID=A0A346A2K7_9HYPH|nr:MgtC/SapB family protein [Pseudolabrys taiwanensis]AXK83404.1 MgtC/SapB family protein [Pseudolabrys taiwanensis]